MKTSKIFFTLVFLTFSLFLINSCKDKESDIQSDLVQASQDDATADDIFDDLSRQADLYQESQKATCPTVTVTSPDSSAFPRHVVIDYGTGCEDAFGRIRKGKIIVDQTDYFFNVDAVRTFTLDNFYINDYHVEGTRAVVCNGRNDENFIQHTITLTGGKVTTPEGLVITRDAVHTREWIEGDSTLINFYDDIWRIKGTAQGVNRFGNEYTSVITQPLIIDMSCMYKLTEGLITINSDNHIVTIDYGSGSCDNQASVTVDGVPHTIQFR